MSKKRKSTLLKVLPYAVSVRLRRRRKLARTDPRFLESAARIRDDAYIDWICRVTGGWLREDDGNLRAFDYAISNMPAEGSVVEIGSFLGQSTNILVYLLTKHGRDHALFNCDPWAFEETGEPIGGYFDASRSDYREYSKQTFVQNMRVFCRDRLPHSIEAFSDDFFAGWDRGAKVDDLFGRPVALGGPISFAYIDGAHTYEASRRDFENVDRHLVPGGYVLLDDTADGSPFECRRTAQEVLADPRYELVFKSPHYLFRRL